MKYFTIILFSLLYYNSLWSSDSNILSLDTAVIEKGKLITPIDTNSNTISLINNEIQKNGYVVSQYNLLNRQQYKSIYINGLYAIDAYKDTNIYNLTTDGHNIKLLVLDKNLNKIAEKNIGVIPTNYELNQYRILKKDNDFLFIKINKLILQIKLGNIFIINKLQLLENDDIICSNHQIFIIRTENTKAILYLVNNNLIQEYLFEFTIYDNYKLINIDHLYYFITSIDNSQESLIQVFNSITNKIESLFWLKSSINNIDIFSKKTKSYLVNIENEKSKRKIKLQLLNSGQIKNLEAEYEIKWNFFGLNQIQANKDIITILFKNGIIQLNSELKILGEDNIDLDYQIKNMNRIDNIIIIGNDTKSQIVFFKSNHLVYFKILLNFLLEYGFIIILTIGLLLLALKYRRKRRFYNEILRHPAIGYIYYLNSKGQLVLANNAGQINLNLNNNIPLKKHFSYYAKNELSKKIIEIINETFENRKNIIKKILITEDNITKDWLINTFIIRNIAGVVRGIVVSANDITEQLERQRLSNLASFAHDMQTNLSTIRLNAEQIDTDDTTTILKKNKILFQTNLLTQRVRDLLAVGRDDILDVEEVLGEEIIKKVYSEFDSDIYPNIKFQSKGNETKVICDINKLCRGLRNAIENSIKYLPNKSGNIAISIYIDNGNYYFVVEDNGIGMDIEIQNKVLTPYFTTAKKTGGSGIGSIIMQKVAELHNGWIEIESEVNKGTKFKFVFPVKHLKLLKNKLNKNDR